MAADYRLILLYFMTLSMKLARFTFVERAERYVQDEVKNMRL